MEKITKKISNIEKVLSEMQKEIIIIKNTTNNTNATNSLNVSKNFANKNNLSIKTNREALHKAKNFFKLSKNYFQLTEKEKFFPKEKRLVKNTHSFNLNKKGLNIYNNIFVNSDNSTNKDDKFETIEHGTINKNNNNKNQAKLNLILNENKKINNKKFKKNDFTVNKSYRDNLGNKNHDLFYDYKLNNNNNFKQYFTNNISTNDFGNIKLFNRTHTKKLNKYHKHSNSSLFYIKKNKNKSKNKKQNDLKNLINFKKDENDDDISCSYNYKKEYENDIKNLYQKNNYNHQEDFKSYQSSIDENTDINEYLAYYQKNKKQRKNSHNSRKERKIKIYSQILNILEDKSINILISKSNLFDKYGTKGFQQYIINNGINLQKNNLDDTEKYLNEYKNYILSLDKQVENDEQINKYKLLYKKLIKMTNSNDIEQLKEDIDFKLRKNFNNKGFLEKVKNILKAY